jgi:acyl transferase domain-containing protein
MADTPASPAPSLTPLQQALLALERMQRRLDAAREPVAIVGMACRLPGGASDPDAYWALLDGHRDAIAEVPRSRWNVDAIYSADPTVPGTMVTHEAGFLHDVDPAGFDAAFFGISPAEAQAMDPQQRLLLELAWEALEDAGKPVATLRGRRVGVYVGAMNADYAALPEAVPDDPYAGPGNDFSFMAGRIAYVFGLRGPTLTVNAACASSLVALHLAAQALRQAEIDLALVGGVTLMLSPGVFIGSSRLGSLAADGRCKSFDAAADGYGRGEGGAIVVLERRSDAEHDGARIHALLRGSAVNHNGASGGATIPSGTAQTELLHAALAASGLGPDAIDYVEAHGTGTRLGDPIELGALAQVFGMRRGPPLAIGSVKTNIGHLEPASGLAGLLKLVLALRHERLPPQLHLRKPTPLFDWAASGLRVLDVATPWPRRQGRVRRAGISSFGLNGSNAHVVIEEPPPAREPPAPNPADARGTVLVLSAADAGALRSLATSWEPTLRDHTLACRAAAAVRRRSALDWRLAVHGADAATLRAGLRAFVAGEAADGLASGRAADPAPRVAFICSGQGGQWFGMGRVLLRTEPVFRAAAEELATVLDPMTSWHLLPVLAGDAPERMAAIDVVQPAIFAMQVAQSKLWAHWGVLPDLVLGQSMGEVAAAAIAGALALADAARVIVARSAMLREVSGRGAMAVAGLGADALAPWLEAEPGLAIAVESGPDSSVVAGPDATIGRLLERLAQHNVFCRRIEVDVASHTSLVDPLLDPLRSALSGIAPRDTAIPLVSTVTGGMVQGSALGPDYWADNLRRPVLLWPALRQAQGAGIGLALEIGPHPVVPAQASAIAGVALMASLRRDSPGTMRASLGALWVRGVAVDLAAALPDAGWADLPRYPWQRRRFWWQGRAPGASLSAAPARPAAEVPDGAIMELAWVAAERAGAPASSPRASRRWLLLLAEPSAWAEQLAVALRSRGDVVRLASGEAPDWAGIDEAILFWPATLGGVGWPRHANLAGSAPDGMRITLLTRGAHGPAPQPLQAAAWGVGRVLAGERQGLHVRLIDCARDVALPVLLDELTAAAPEEQISLLDNRRLAPRLRPAALAAPGEWRWGEGTYLVTGGLGRLGRALAVHLVRRGVRSLVLAGRSGAAGDAAREATVAALRAAGAQVEVAACDLAAPGAAEALVGQCGDDLAGVLHLAGTSRYGLLGEIAPDDWQAVLGAKAEGALHLHAATCTRRLRCFVLFSSAAGVWGAQGQAAYAAANAVLDALAAHRRAQGLPALSVAWGRWAEAGQASETTDAFLDAIGLLPFATAAGFAIMESLLAAGASAPVVANVDWANFLPLQELRGPRALFDAVRPTVLPSAPTRSALAALPAVERRDAAIAAVARLAAAAMGYEQDAVLPEQEGFFRLGMDSIMAVRLQAALQRELGVAIPPTAVFEHPTAQALGTHLAELLGAESDGTAAEEAEAEAQLRAELAELRAEQA